MDPIAALWQRLEVGLPPLTGSPLAPGASEAAITHLESVLGIRLPEDVRASYGRHDGGFPMQLANPMTLLPLEGSAEWWQILAELRQDDEWARQTPYYFTEEAVRLGSQPGPIQPVWWHPRWIPVAADRGGNLSCMDLAPAPGGTVGQIIDWDHECGPVEVLFPSLTHLLTALADEVENTINRQVH